MPKVQKHCIADVYFYFEGSVSYVKGRQTTLSLTG